MAGPAVAATSPGGRTGATALAVSSASVVAAACVFDVLAGQRPDHTLALVVVAGTVGVVRRLLRGRLRGVFTLVNLAVLAQPVAHVLGGLTHVAVGPAPHVHVLPERLLVLAVQVLVAVLVALVAGSEPIMVYAASTALATVLLARGSPVATVPPRQAAPVTADVPAVRIGVAVRCRPRRGPPAPLGFTG